MKSIIYYSFFILLSFVLNSCSKSESNEIYTLNPNYKIGEEYFFKVYNILIVDDTTSTNKDSIIKNSFTYKLSVEKDTIINNIICKKLNKEFSNNIFPKNIEFIQVKNDGIYRVATFVREFNSDTLRLSILSTPLLLIPRPLRYRNSFLSYAYDGTLTEFEINEQKTINLGGESIKCLGFENNTSNSDDPNIFNKFKIYYSEYGYISSRYEAKSIFTNASGKKTGIIHFTLNEDRYIP